MNSASYVTATATQVKVTSEMNVDKGCWKKHLGKEGGWQSVVCLGRGSRKNNLGEEAKMLRALSAKVSLGVRSARSWEDGWGFQLSANWVTVLTARSCTAGLPKRGCLTGSSGWSRKHLMTADFFLWKNPQDHNFLFSCLGQKVKCYFVLLTAFLS